LKNRAKKDYQTMKCFMMVLSSSHHVLASELIPDFITG